MAPSSRVFISDAQFYSSVLDDHPAETICVKLDGRVLYANRSGRKLFGNPENSNSDNLFDMFSESDGNVREKVRQAAGTSNWSPLALTLDKGHHKGLKLSLRCRGLRDTQTNNVVAVIVTEEQRNLAFEEHRRLIRSLNAELAEQHKMRRRLDRALKNEAHLHQELIHRVKNNLALLSSLIRLKSNLAKTDDVKAALDNIQSRVQSIAIVHDVLDQKQDIDTVDAKDMVGRLCKEMQTSLCPPGVTMNCELSTYLLHVKDATPLALLINELVTNSLKHAFNDKEGGEVVVKLMQNGVDKVEVLVSDNGSGYDVDAESDGSGNRIVRALAQQLRGDLDVNTGQGTSWTLIFEPQAVEETLH